MTTPLGATVEAFTLPRAGGGDRRVDPAAHAATAVIWTANRCPYALAWHDRIQAVAREYADRDVAVVQINANDAAKHPHDSLEAMTARVAAGEFGSDYLRDAEQEVSKRWGAAVTPDVFVIDTTGHVVYHGAPDADHDDPAQAAAYLRDALDDVLAGRPVQLAETRAVGCTVKWLPDA